MSLIPAPTTAPYTDPLPNTEREHPVSAYAIARKQIDAALAEAAESSTDDDAVLRALLATFAERYRTLKGVDDLRAVLQYQLDNAAGDEDHLFMRP